MRHYFNAVLSLIATLLPQTLSGQQPRTATVEDVLSFKAVGSPAISPDGEWVAYVVTVRDMEENAYNADVWVVDTDGGTPIQLTRGPAFDGDPTWSPDGAWLAFRSDRNGENQIYGIDIRGGEAWAVTESETSVGDFAISRDGARIGWIASDEEPDADAELEKERGRPIVADSAYATDWTHLWTAELVDRVAGEATRTSPEGQHVSSLVWAPDARRIAWGARFDPALRTYVDGAVFVQDLEEGEARQITWMDGGEGPTAWTESLGLLVTGSGQRLGTYNNRIWRVATDGEREPTALTGGLDEHAGFIWAGADDLLVETSFGAGRGLRSLSVGSDGPGTVVYDGPLFTSSFSATRDGRAVAFLGQDPSSPPDVYVAEVGAFRPRRLTDVNPQAASLAWGETRTVTWASRADGEPIEGILTLPVGYEEGQRVPLLLRIHGGPSGVSTLSFHGDDGAYPTQVFAGMGYAVLQPNYRGSTGYGERFRGLNRGDISGKDWVDVDSGVDHLIEQGLADPDRLGIMGWSFGGHHTYWGITQTERYKAASAGAGASELISMFHQTDLPGFYHTYLGPSPWEDWDLYEDRSAYRRVERVTTPLLIQVGQNDVRVPKEQSRMFYEAMKALGNAPVKMVTYPGQPHGVREPALQRDLMTRNVEWFQRWIPTSSNVTDDPAV